MKFEDIKYKPTGIDLLDEKLGGGLREVGSYLVASEKKAGKSSFIRKLVFNMLSLGEKILLVDTEELQIDVVKTMIAIAENKPVNEVDKDDFEKFEPLLDNFICFDSVASIDQLYIEGEFDLERLEKLVKKHNELGIEVVVFDNVTRIGSEQSSSFRMKVMATLARLAKELAMTVIVVGHTPSGEVETLSQTDIKRAVETRQFEDLITTTHNFVQRPRDPYGGSVTSQFDAVFVVWRPFQYFETQYLQTVSWLVVEQIRNSKPFTLRMRYNGDQRNFVVVENVEKSEVSFRQTETDDWQLVM